MISFKKIFQFVKNKIRGAPNFNESAGKLQEENNININYQNQKTMTLFNFGVGGNEVKVDANEEIP